MESSTTGCVWILVADQAIRETLKALAQSRGQKTVEFSSLSRAREKLREFQKSPEGRTPLYAPTLVISNLELPDGSSAAWLAEIRKRFPQAKIQRLSGQPTRLGQLVALLEQS